LVFATQRFAASSGSDLRAFTLAETDAEAREIVETTLPQVLMVLLG